MSDATKEKRQNTRAPVELKVRVGQRTEQEFIEVFAANISAGGMFLKIAKPYQPGTPIRFEIQLREGEPVLQGLGLVAWHRATSADPKIPTGMGIKFEKLDERSQEVVRRVVEQKRSGVVETAPAPQPTTPPPADGSPPQAGAGPSTEDRRIHPRVPLGITVRMREKSMAEFLERYAVNISAGGIFLRNPSPHPVGTVIQFEIQLEGGEVALKGAGEVVRSVQPSGPGELPRVPGMGVRFLELDEASREKLRSMVEKRKMPVPTPETHRIPSAADAPAPEKKAPPAPAPQVPAATGRAAALEGAALKKLVVDSLVSSLELSRVPQFEDTQLIGSLLDSWYSDFFRNNVVDLTMLWNTLMSEEGVSHDQAGLPLVIFALSRPVHGLQCMLPEGLRTYVGVAQIKDEAIRRIEQGGGFSKTLAQVEARPRSQSMLEDEATPAPAKEGEARRDEPARSTQQEERKEVSRRKKAGPRAPASLKVRLITGALVAIALAALTLGLLSAFPRKAAPFDTSSVAFILNLENAFRQGPVLNAVIADEGWWSLSADQCRETVSKIAENLLTVGIDTVILYNKFGEPAAMASPGPGGKPKVRLGEELWMAGVPQKGGTK